MKEICLTLGKVALVDDEDWAWLSKWRWYARRHWRGKYFYATRKHGRNGSIQMSRVILGLTDPKVFAEHKNGDTLDNRRENLRPATHAQNLANTGLWKNNTSGVRGVYYCLKRKKWEAYISFNGKRFNLGRFLTKEEAANAVFTKALELYGEFVPKA